MAVPRKAKSAPDNDFLDGAGEIAAFLRCSYQTAIALCEAGMIPAFKWALPGQKPKKRARWRARKSALLERAKQLESAA
jgi:hypothetical protein